MRFAACLLAVFLCSTIHAQNKIDLAKPPAPPPPTDVNVLNWPDVQPVAGTVSVDNLPAVQTVGGTVNVGNLPLDTDGALRVTSAPARQMVMHELISEPLVLPTPDPTGPGTISMDLPNIIDTSGYASVGFWLRTVGFNNTGLEPLWQWVDDESFTPWRDARSGTAFSCSGGGENRVTCSNLGGKLRIRLYWNQSQTVSSVRVYLFP